jgi:hypothetical protein
MSIVSEDVVPQDEFKQTDDMIERDRAVRALSSICTFLFLPVVGGLIGYALAALFRLPLVYGYAPGVALGTYWSFKLRPRYINTNGVTMANMTIDPLVSLLHRGGWLADKVKKRFPSLAAKSPLVVYGPGANWSHWWEHREKGNTVDLSESAESFVVEVQAKNGKVKMPVSVRLRPDIKHVHEFLGGSAALASNITGLIKSFISEKVSSMTVERARKAVTKLNKELMQFKHRDGQHPIAKDFETRFGVIIGDITIETVLLDVEETMKSKSEADIINTIVATTLGYTNHKAAAAALKAGTLSEPLWRAVHTRVMAMSGNLQGMKLDDSTSTFNINIAGLKEALQELKDMDPESVKALAGIGSAAAVAAASRSKQKKGDKE